ncbi:MAG: hypothetical protein ACYCZZ_00010 [Minisyncoccota bacterium]
MSEGKSTFPVVISSPDEIVWKGEAESVSAENSAGKFDILFEHANFVTFAKANSSILIRTADGHTNVFSYKDSVIAVKSGKVNIYVEL